MNLQIPKLKDFFVSNYFKIIKPILNTYDNKLKLQETKQSLVNSVSQKEDLNSELQETKLFSSTS